MKLTQGVKKVIAGTVLAGASVLVGLYLVRALVVDLRQPCPL